MALEAVIFSQDPLTSYNYCKQYSSSNNFYNLGGGSSLNCYDYDYTNYSSSKFEDKPIDGIFDSNINNYCDYSSSNASPSDHNINDAVMIINNPSWDDLQSQHYSNDQHSKSDNHRYLVVEEEPPMTEAAPVVAAAGGGRRKRRRRSCKNKEEVEQQRMTHIAVERNRRKQMNEYLAVIRSLMPASYAQRGDQASVVGGAINYVKELEQHLQNLEAQKRTTKLQKQQVEQVVSSMNNTSCSEQQMEGSSQRQIFGSFFSFPQYSNRSSSTTMTTGSSQPQGGGNNGEILMMRNKSKTEATGEIEVNMADSHANVRILAKKQPKQLLRLVAAFQGLRLTILHLNVTSFDSLVLYSFSLKVEEGCELNSIDDIADATNHILGQIQEEAATLL